MSLTDEQQVLCFNTHVPFLENTLAGMGVPRDQAHVLAVMTVLSYIEEAQQEAGPSTEIHKYGVKVVMPESTAFVYITFTPP